jgi:hypothetical protein
MGQGFTWDRGVSDERKWATDGWTRPVCGAALAARGTS